MPQGLSWRMYIPLCALALMYGVKMSLKMEIYFRIHFPQKPGSNSVFSWPTKFHTSGHLNPSLRLKYVRGIVSDARETSCNYCHSSDGSSKLVT